MKLVLAKQEEGCAVRKGGDILNGYIEVVEPCITGLEFSITFKG